MPKPTIMIRYATVKLEADPVIGCYRDAVKNSMSGKETTAYNRLELNLETLNSKHKKLQGKIKFARTPATKRSTKETSVLLEELKQTKKQYTNALRQLLETKNLSVKSKVMLGMEYYGELDALDKFVITHLPEDVLIAWNIVGSIKKLPVMIDGFGGRANISNNLFRHLCAETKLPLALCVLAEGAERRKPRKNKLFLMALALQRIQKCGWEGTIKEYQEKLKPLLVEYASENGMEGVPLDWVLLTVIECS